ncbi:prefoldin subunit 4 [Cryptococcus deuterogattii 99/473]|uniref:Prefoldin subunit 4 n=2 Tax=Cryptococcus deuterogattii TaxID=1859096 RepID=A0A0D0UUN4_9TREE|nr:prefoldin subunit 4 [Cryptococcus deuterogattii R265]KIR26997.1 prefoldin subunit 4 [Cryptococcus deuterogattii LA55]KIR36528.1 prefoldin subunit 4 [Cryptococcus deuterogattii MMRL2647]KIR38931.1 prefoldin subunit 4 [Cryptococcus deuterogattii Ram5]KIR75958.1 prefoldin subunit 4 [Cryptococcus deuterogattii CA1014]KIR95901.1 prefoldin subunit 4 [Cryptococcus deuterogattii CBS 10090]KIS02397.1 prefoldin subunit 4 [Cryptococcus deuterogattii 2001/935-1]KIY58844.1 prefoldin subunit 4 [Cryptoc
MSLLPPEEEGDGVEVAWEDQQRINTFSKLNNRLSDIQDLLKAKNEEKEYYDDLCTELELADEDNPQPVLYKIGEAFFYLHLRDARRQLKGDLKKYEKEIEGLESKARECENGMKELKVLLYAKFGKQINLETTP